MISYGPCQFPTLGFIVERYQLIRDFVPEDYWSLKLKLTRDQNSCEFNWQRIKLFDQETVEALKECCDEAEWANVKNVVKKLTKKMRPQPLNTIEA